MKCLIVVALLCTAPLLSGAATPEELARQAKNAMASARYAEAAAIYQQLLRTAPENTGLRFNLALALHSAGNFSEAVPQLEQVTREQPQFTNAFLILGLAYQKLGKPELAITPLEHVAKSDPQNHIALLELGDAYLSTGKAADAARCFSTLSSAEPSAAKPLQGLGTAYLALARQTFEQLNSRFPDSPFAAALMAQTSLDQGQYRTAFGLARKARTANPPIPDLDLLIANIYRGSGHADWAGELAARSPKSLPANCEAGGLACLFLTDRLDELLRAAGRSQEPAALYWKSRTYSRLAERALNRLAELPESAEWHEVLAEAYRLQGRKEDSVRQWQAAVRLAPRDSYALHGLARALWLQRNYAEAQPLIERLLKSSPESPELNYELGDILLEQQSIEAALPLLKKAIAMGVTTSAAHKSLGLALLKTGKAQEAIPHLQAALPGDVDGSLHHQLGRAWQQLGNSQKAKQYFDEQARMSERQASPEVEITRP